MKKLFKFLPLFLVILLSLPAVSFFFEQGFFPMHDDTQVARVAQMAKALSETHFPVRWVADLGYGLGYPIFNFYNPFSYYFGGFLSLLGFNSLLATKITFVFAVLLAGAGMFFLARHFFGNWGGVLAALFYIYTPYHAVQVYVRGSLAELWAYGFLPFVFLGVLKRDTFFGGICLALLILSHNLTAVIALPAVVVLMLILTLKAKDKKRCSWWHSYMITLLIGLSLSCFFWLPAILEKKYTAVDQMIAEKFDPLLHFVTPWQLWASPWGFGGSAPGLKDGMSFQIGKIHILASLFALFTIIYFWRKNKKQVVILLAAGCWLLAAVFMTLPISKPIWQILSPVLSYLQFPWRFLTFISLASSFLAGSVVIWGKKFNLIPARIGIYVLLIVALIFLNKKYFAPKFIYSAKEEDFLTEERLFWETSSISDEYLPVEVSRPRTKNEVYRNKFVFENGRVEQLEKTAVFYKLKVDSEKENILKINNAYFPGWKAWLDDKIVEIGKENGLINVKMPSGEHELVVKFTDTVARRVGNLVSLASLLIVLFFTVRAKSRTLTTITSRLVSLLTRGSLEE